MKTLFALLVTASLFGCTKTEVAENTVEKADPSLLDGGVILYDEGTNTADFSGMTVSVENSNPLITTKTDAKGMFSLRIDTSIKSFTLVYSKPLYGDFKEYYIREKDTLYQIRQTYYETKQVKVPVIDGHLSSLPNLGRKSTTKVNSLRTAMVNGKLRIICNISYEGNIASSNGRFVQLFYQTTPIDSFSTVPKTAKNMSGPIGVINNGDNTLDFCMDCCLKGVAGMKSGDTVYIMACGTSYFDGNFFDMRTGKIEFPTMNFSNVVTPVSFVLP